jgi:hypothetical protein
MTKKNVGRGRIALIIGFVCVIFLFVIFFSYVYVPDPSLQKVDITRALNLGCAMLRTDYNCAPNSIHTIITDYKRSGHDEFASLYDMCTLNNPSEMNSINTEQTCARLCGCPAG